MFNDWILKEDVICSLLQLTFSQSVPWLSLEQGPSWHLKPPAAEIRMGLKLVLVFFFPTVFCDCNMVTWPLVDGFSFLFVD